MSRCRSASNVCYYSHMHSIMLPVVIEPDEDQFHAWTPTLAGCHSFGATYEEALNNIAEAAALHIESMEEHGDILPAGNPAIVLTSLTVPLAS